MTALSSEGSPKYPVPPSFDEYGSLKMTQLIDKKIYDKIKSKYYNSNIAYDPIKENR
jgi:hypothetical protein